MQDIINIIESLLFATEEPLTIDKLKSVLETVEGKEIRSALQTLSDQYNTRGGGFMLCEVAGGWQLRSRPEYNEWIKRLLQPSPQRMSKPALETLAIIAYNQPIIRSDIEHIRGVDCGGVLRQLMERKLVRVLGRKEIPGRPLIYATTKLFLELFGLKDLKDLPSTREIEEMAAAMEEADLNTRTDMDETQDRNMLETSGQIDAYNFPSPMVGSIKSALGSGETAARGRSSAATETISRANRHRSCLPNYICKPTARIHWPPVRIAALPHRIPTGRKNAIGS